MMKCTLFANSLSKHLNQIYTGFSMLHKKGLIRLKQRMAVRDSPHLLLATLDSIRIQYDVRDGRVIRKELLKDCDIYFKRSYSNNYVIQFQDGYKVKPFGLNYNVWLKNFDWQRIKRGVAFNPSFRKKIASFISGIDTLNTISYNPRLNELEALPHKTQKPEVLFMVTAYDPYDKPERPVQEIKGRHEIAEFRAACIRSLRQEFGPMCLAGFNKNAYTTKYFHDLILPDKVTSQRRYLNLVKKHPICVATTGLHGSIGWKFGEYVALSRAIVSEPLIFEVPGVFSPGKNYLEFKTPAQCVEAISLLMNNPDLLKQMMYNNYIYYMCNLRPDILILNTLLQAIIHHASMESDKHQHMYKPAQ